MATAEPLAPDYYLQNFYRLLNHVSQLYADLLNLPETQWCENFLQLSPDAQKLYVRLSTRAGPAILQDRLRYDEISDLNAVLAELCSWHLVALNPTDLELEYWLARLTKAQLSRLISSTELPSLAATSRRQQLQEHVQNWAATNASTAAVIRAIIATQHPVVVPLQLEHLQTFRLLFFGNLYQDMSEFIISDLGHVRYEAYVIDRHARPFQHRDQVDATLRYHTLAATLEDELGHLPAEQIIALARQLPAHNEHPQLRRRHDRLINSFARQLERLKQPEQALHLYRSSALPPARERQCRLLVKLNLAEQALVLLTATCSDPANEAEAIFADNFQRRLTGEKSVRFTPTQRDWVVDEIIDGPEATALTCYADQGFNGAHVENSLINTLFALLFWDILFMPQAGVFSHPFQRGPADLFAPEFYRQRRSHIEQRLELISGSNNWQDLAQQTLREKFGLANHFTNWQWPQQDILTQAMATIPGAHLALIFRRLLRDLRHNRSGLPDLILFKNNDYLLVEVKGPGDSLQDNQIAWLHYFNQHHIPAEVAYLKKAD